MLSVLTGVRKRAKVHHPAIVIPPIKRAKNDAAETLRFYAREEAAAQSELTVRHTLWRGTLVSPKNGKPRRVPMTALLLAALQALPRDSEWVLPCGRQSKPGSPRAAHARR